MRPDIIPGAVFPDYDLADHTGKHRKLSELQGSDPMILVLSRGGFCPKDRRQAENLVQLHREMEVGYCRLVTISTDNLLETNEYRTGVDAHWPCLSDAGRRAKRPRHRRVHRSPAQSDDPARRRSRTRPRHLQDLLRLLVLRPSYKRRAAPGSARGPEKVPPRLGHHHPRPKSRLGPRRKTPLLPLRQTLRQSLQRTRVGGPANRWEEACRAQFSFTLVHARRSCL